MTIEHVLQRIEARAEECDSWVAGDEMSRLAAELRAELREEHDRAYRQCRAEDCSWVVQIPRCLCPYHWHLIGEEMRYRLLTTQVGGEHSPEFAAALLAAVDAIQAAEGQREQPEVDLYPDFTTEAMR